MLFCFFVMQAFTKINEIYGKFPDLVAMRKHLFAATARWHPTSGLRNLHAYIPQT
jgi:hypothetical protein